MVFGYNGEGDAVDWATGIGHKTLFSSGAHLSANPKCEWLNNISYYCEVLCGGKSGKGDGTARVIGTKCDIT